MIASKVEFTDIDSDKKDPQMCSLYACEIYSNLRVAELMHRPHSDFMETLQRDVTQSMRGVLVDWIVEVREEYKLVPDTLYLTVYLIDLFLSLQYIERPKLQLLGITCMLIASKYEEISAPGVEEFCFITDNTCTKSEVLKMESVVLNYLNFQLSAPRANTFLRRFIRAAQASQQVILIGAGNFSQSLWTNLRLNCSPQFVRARVLNWSFNKNRDEKRASIKSMSIFSGSSSYSSNRSELESKRRRINAATASELLVGGFKPSSWARQKRA